MMITLLYPGMSNCAVWCISVIPSTGWENKQIHRTVSVKQQQQQQQQQTISVPGALDVRKVLY
jgi:hypothetical protein